MTVPLAPPAVSPFRTLLVLFVIVHFSHQQDIRQPWDGSRLIPINVVDEHRSNSSQVQNHSSSPGTIRNNRPEQIYDNEEQDAGAEDESYDDYLAETEEEDPELNRNRETVAVHRVSKEKIINETTIFHSGETNGTDYPDYNYYDYDYDNDTNFDNKDQVEEKVKGEPPVEIEYVEDTSLNKPETEEAVEKEVSEEKVSGNETPEKEDPAKEVSEEEEVLEKEEVSEKETPEKEVSDKDDEDYLILNTEETPLDEEKEEEEPSNSSILIGEAIVSVVTTKSVVNGTFSVPVTPLPQTTEQLDPPQSSSPQPESSSSSAVTENTLQVTTEDSEKVLASVQTVRSISGARFLPFPGIDPLQYGHETTAKTIQNPATTDKSTESIIEKLDRVQSELSSGIIATNFGSGNNIQVDSNSAKVSQKGYGTTLKTPVVSKFIPKRYSDRRLIKTTTSTPQIEPEKTEVTSTTTRSTTVKKTVLGNLTVAVPDISAFLPPGYKLKPETTTEKSLLSEILNKSKVDISAFLPPGYRAPVTQKTEPTSENPTTTTSSPTTSTTQKAVKAISSLQDLFAKSEVDLSALLPKDYKEKIPSTTATIEAPSVTTEKSTNSSGKKVTSIQDLFAKSEVDLTDLLPKDYKPRFKAPEIKTKLNKDNKQSGNPLVSSTTEVSTTTKAGAIKLVFPSRPGGRKNIVKATTASPKSDGFEQVTPKIQKGWPVRATTEFTGWPKPSTTPISIEKLLEAARTATVSSLSNTSVELTTSTVSSTSTTTTTTTTPRPTTPGICDEECKVAGTIRLVGTATWVPELLDRNTREWQDLADRIEKEMNFVLSKSPTLSKWFKEVKIDSFSQGSILVDYFIELVDVKKPVNTQELKGIFHDSLNIYNSNRYNDTSANATVKLGPFTIDPKSTDFIVIPKVSIPLHVEDDKLIPQWVIAVIVIGVGGLLFIIVFGVSVLANRRNVSKLKPSMSTMYEEEISKHNMHTSNSVPQMQQRSSDYSKSNASNMWNDPSPMWSHDKAFESNSNKALMDVPIPFNEDKRYNVYDSWRSEWNGYYYNPSQTSSRYARYDSTINLSHHHPEYGYDDDTNF